MLDILGGMVYHLIMVSNSIKRRDEEMYKLVHYRFRGGAIKVHKDGEGYIPLFQDKQAAYDYSKGMHRVFPDPFNGKVTKRHRVIAS